MARDHVTEWLIEKVEQRIRESMVSLAADLQAQRAHPLGQDDEEGRALAGVPRH
ncbi:hypothetical protein GCM10010387_22470 [Streptomyces inusitatus]|uniref:Uncharacterized protein n=1 Tax=Streptomyces inusitatus TaxID=68221 RepID=A0A918PZK1_9ACTN|nr:hypothetical protein [Streptomyces inusitatus]GGZ28514.1 hypothetical protein GCM10010387_22470 [Streptomyces inusitatus]